MSRSLLEIVVIFLLLIANGIFAMSEAAIISARKARLQHRAEEGDKQAKAALDLAANPNQFLAAVQIGITLVGIFAGAFGGATIAEEIALLLNQIPALAPYGETIGVVVVVLLITYFSLIIGELVPKRLALNNAEQIAAIVAGPMGFLARYTRPVVWFLGVSTDMVIRLLGVRPAEEPTITPEEIKVLIEQGTESGVFEASEQDMIERVLQLDERPVGLLMTPRSQIVWFDIADPPAVVQQKITTCRYSRFPVIEGNFDKVLGVVRVKELLLQHLAGQPFQLGDLLQPVLFVPENLSALRVLELFKQKESSTALVLDEYGGVQGMVTHNDILEAVVGYMPPAGASQEPQAIQRGDGSWLLDGLLHIDQLKEIFEIDKLPHEERGRYRTVAGFVINQLRRIPAVGQFFEWEQLRFEVVDMDGYRVDKVLVSPVLAGGEMDSTGSSH